MSFSAQQVRERIAKNRGVASGVLGALGKKLPDPPDPKASKSERLEARNDCRRTMRDLMEATRNRHMTDDEQKTFDALTDSINLIDHTLDLDGEIARALARNGAPAGDDNTGVRVLDKRALSSRATIADAIGTGHRPEAGGFDLADFVRGVAGDRKNEAIRNALSTGTDSAGGFAVPSVLMPDVLAALAPVSSLLTAGANIGLLTEPGKTYRIAGINAIPTAAWRAEAGAVATSDPTFRGIDMVPRSLAFQFKVSRELLADSPNLNRLLLVAIAQAFAKELDRVGLRGTGTAPEPRGILNTVGIQSVTNGANGASLGTTAYSNLISAMQAIRAADGPMPTAAIMAPRSLGTLGGLLDTTNQPRQVPPLLSAWEMIDTSQIPTTLTVGTSTDCSELYVADFTNLVFYMREQLTIALATELYAGTGEVGFFCHTRADVAVLYPAAFAVVTGVRA